MPKDPQWPPLVPQQRHLDMAAEVNRQAFPLGHCRRCVPEIGPDKRQVCCTTCHTCLQPLRADGWCETCQEYR
ncbi:MAG: hypothetical protein KKB13_08060 [Chloroflexi bacterium]|nr:hypothetical protein [Chloroflexota bacterium]